MSQNLIFTIVPKRPYYTVLMKIVHDNNNSNNNSDKQNDSDNDNNYDNGVNNMQKS